MWKQAGWNHEWKREKTFYGTFNNKKKSFQNPLKINKNHTVFPVSFFFFSFNHWLKANPGLLQSHNSPKLVSSQRAQSLLWIFLISFFPRSMSIDPEPQAEEGAGAVGGRESVLTYAQGFTHTHLFTLSQPCTQTSSFLLGLALRTTLYKSSLLYWKRSLRVSFLFFFYLKEKNESSTSERWAVCPLLGTSGTSQSRFFLSPCRTGRGRCGPVCGWRPWSTRPSGCRPRQWHLRAPGECRRHDAAGGGRLRSGCGRFDLQSSRYHPGSRRRRRHRGAASAWARRPRGKPGTAADMFINPHIKWGFDLSIMYF